MRYQHKELSQGKWFNFTFLEQMANIGSEIERAIRWRDKIKQYSINAVDRALELLGLTISDSKNIKRLKELTRLKELLIDYFYFDNKFSSSDKLWKNYFYPFIYAARKNK